MNKKSSRREIIAVLSNITQLGIYVAVSFGIWIFIAAWLRRTFGLGNYVSVIGVLLGAGSGALSFWKFCKQVILRSGRKDGSDEK